MSWHIDAVRDTTTVSTIASGHVIQVPGPRTFTLHGLPVPDHATVHDIMIRRGGRARVPLADWTAGRGWQMSDIPLTEDEAMAMANGADPLMLLAGPRIRLEIVRL